ncbi:LuxR family transcriptional regulator [Mesorhizobium sp. Root157]|uniref:helix-turn-helix transcriptional regulator n=1 Tax=Mesorhizobium sp. Root157 TaxID=1736477 RepID=UPI0006F20D7D|nr:helix-turn-helix transcriptional regulator [Mesorhizobium sp. Root157]KQZ87018.1 LuxR family transcriptional regulator [Mesorhizobium sp. Root157]
MTSAAARQSTETPFNDQRNPFGPSTPALEAHQTVSIADAVRRCRWIAIDVNATSFGLFMVGPSLERARLVPCFDSDYPNFGIAKTVSALDCEEIVRHVRVSTQPRWWSDGNNAIMQERLADLSWASSTQPLVRGTAGVAFPVHAERGRCGLVVFTGDDMSVEQGMLYDIHARCFSLFSAVSRIRPGDTGLSRAMSRRELECLKLTANGYTSEEIARLLKLSVHTANQYLTQSAQKLNAVSRTQAVAKALRLGLIE